MITQTIIILISVTFGWILRDIKTKKIVKNVYKAKALARRKIKTHRGVIMEWQRPEEPEKEAEKEARKGL